MAIDPKGAIYVYGGRDVQGRALSDFWRLGANHRRWEQLSNKVVPPLIEPHLAADMAGNIFEFGGITRAKAAHLSVDGHSYGLYEYKAKQGTWVDLTPSYDIQFGLNWPQAREDHGFAFDPDTDQFFVFAGEGVYDYSLNDMWAYDERSGTWRYVVQDYQAPDGARIAPREIYNISYDYHGGFYLFGGAYLMGAGGSRITQLYANDLWRFDVATGVWTLLAGEANAYDPHLPMPRHYYGQACDDTGTFYVLGGYIGVTTQPPFFANDAFRSYAHSVRLGVHTAARLFTYALSDFWQFVPTIRHWRDLSARLGALSRKPLIPYVMVDDRTTSQLITFGGFQTAQSGILTPSSSVWSYHLPAVTGPSSNSAGAEAIAAPRARRATTKRMR